ncbi:MAG: hypothetical protein O3A63_10075 [Proteobacteria bacterium]|nr:hypothetical protein [Pseudomonadota bacterium]
MDTDTGITATDLILALVDSAVDPALPASYLINVGQLFDLDAGNIRVALTRLVKRKVLAQRDRGHYGLGRRAETLHRANRRWATVEEGLKTWDGDWLAVNLTHLPRRKKTDVRRWGKALQFYGLAQASPGLWLRPANLRIDPQALHDDLVSLAGGVMGSAWLYRITDLVPADQIDPASLWDIAGLESAYQIWSERLKSSTKTLQQQDYQGAARETLLVGRAVTRLILIDPLLPEEMIDTQARSRLITAMREYDRIGKRIWRKLYETHRSALPKT